MNNPHRRPAAAGNSPGIERNVWRVAAAPAIVDVSAERAVRHLKLGFASKDAKSLNVVAGGTTFSIANSILKGNWLWREDSNLRPTD